MFCFLLCGFIPWVSFGGGDGDSGGQDSGFTSNADGSFSGGSGSGSFSAGPGSGGQGNYGGSGNASGPGGAIDQDPTTPGYQDNNFGWANGNNGPASYGSPSLDNYNGPDMDPTTPGVQDNNFGWANGNNGPAGYGPGPGGSYPSAVTVTGEGVPPGMAVDPQTGVVSLNGVPVGNVNAEGVYTGTGQYSSITGNIAGIVGFSATGSVGGVNFGVIAGSATGVAIVNAVQAAVAYSSLSGTLPANALTVGGVHYTVAQLADYAAAAGLTVTSGTSPQVGATNANFSWASGLGLGSGYFSTNNPSGGGGGGDGGVCIGPSCTPNPGCVGAGCGPGGGGGARPGSPGTGLCYTDWWICFLDGTSGASGGSGGGNSSGAGSGSGGSGTTTRPDARFEEF